MQPFTTLTGKAAPLMIANIDTDVIIRINRMGGGAAGTIGHYAFEALRYLEDGSENPDFVLNQDRYRGAPILLAGPNFGCGSSREPAVWALQGLGLRCVIAASFGDIFYANGFQNGLLPIRLPDTVVSGLAAEAAGGDAPMTVDLARQVVVAPSGVEHGFEIDLLRRTALLEGLDDIGLTLKDLAVIEAWQAADADARPWVWRLDPAATLRA